MNACGSTDGPGSSAGGGAGVRSKVLTRENTVECGAGSVTRLLELDVVPSSQGTDRDRV